MPLEGCSTMEPALFTGKFGTNFILIDLSSGAPSYNPASLSYKYFKINLESKKIPNDKELHEFIRIIRDNKNDEVLFGVHCNYGYNRTGYFICAYLILEEKMNVEAALKLFANNRAPGIRHQHYRDSLHLRFTPYQLITE